MFVDSVVFKDIVNDKVSLNDHCVDLQLNYDVNVRKQSLDARFDEPGVRFIKELLKLQLAAQLETNLKSKHLNSVLQHFSAVKIKDSTRFQVPGLLASSYPGPTGGASGAGIHIQFEFDLLHGKVTDLEVHNALRQDNTDAIEKKTQIQKGDLIIRDLGYSSCEVFEHIIDQEAFFLNRLTAGINVYERNGSSKIDFTKVRKRMKRKGLKEMEMQVDIGRTHVVPVRLILQLLPDHITEERLRKAKKHAIKDKRNLTEEYKSRVFFNLFITNAHSSIIPIDAIRDIYRLRWQVELMFKTWKSFYRLDKCMQMKKPRFECYLYGLLLLIMINWEIGSNLIYIVWKAERRIISIYKFFKTASRQVTVLGNALIRKREILADYLTSLLQACSTKLLIERKKNHSAPIEKILLQNFEHAYGKV
jgi:hypothetical protein